jgi:hypothetical protein
MLAFGAVHVPIEGIDINTQTGKSLKTTRVGKTTAWKDVPSSAM